MTLKGKDEETGKEIVYQPFMQGDKVGIEITVGDKTRKVWLETCPNEPMVWVHSDLPDNHDEFITFITASELLE